MKLPILLVTLLAAGSVFAQDKPWPMPSSLPVLPANVNSAVYAMPKTEWLSRVQTAIEKAHAPGTTIDLIFDGDSITDGWQGGGRNVWAQRYEKLNAFDFGIAGDCTQHVLWRLSQGQVDGLHPKLIALMIGTNNGRNTVEETADGVKAVVKEYQKRCPEAVILLQGIFPRSEKQTDPQRAKIKAVNQILSTVADGKKVIFIDFGDKFLSPDGTLTKEIMPDFLHPSAKGYEIWANAIQPTIDQFFSAAKH